ncbi:hypothetical protein FALBO_6854 [Fusarium albosuccineum]|uniref:Antifungal protein n=1 Tax=Fusarium albosuccineum TaxID=1237068 RepID=A0A8H4P8G2_9HYPO|nr:hypothetical protein FALBO_6854 [Fusarium albosuccineum]
MLFNTLLINALLAMTSVAALPNPDTKAANLAARGDDDSSGDDGYYGGDYDGDYDGYGDDEGHDDKLKARAPSCRGSGSFYRNGRCSCRMSSYIYDPSYGCHYDCHGSDSYWSNGSCRCRRKEFRWDDSSHRCRRG